MPSVVRLRITMHHKPLMMHQRPGLVVGTHGSRDRRRGYGAPGIEGSWRKHEAVRLIKASCKGSSERVGERASFNLLATACSLNSACIVAFLIFPSYFILLLAGGHESTWAASCNGGLRPSIFSVASMLLAPVGQLTPKSVLTNYANHVGNF